MIQILVLQHKLIQCRQRIVAENPKELVTKLKSEIERIIATRLSFSAPSITATIQEGGDLYQGQFEYIKEESG